MSTDPMVKDPVAQHLAGLYGLSHGRLMTKLLQEQEGWGGYSQGSIQVPVAP